MRLIGFWCRAELGLFSFLAWSELLGISNEHSNQLSFLVTDGSMKCQIYPFSAAWWMRVWPLYYHISYSSYLHQATRYVEKALFISCRKEESSSKQSQSNPGRSPWQYSRPEASRCLGKVRLLPNISEISEIWYNCPPHGTCYLDLNRVDWIKHASHSVFQERLNYWIFGARWNPKPKTNSIVFLSCLTIDRTAAAQCIVSRLICHLVPCPSRPA